jgi:hypothetical protein
MQKLSSQQSHHPASHKNSAEKHEEAIKAIPHHFIRFVAVGDAKDNRGKEREHRSRAEMIESDGH